MGRFRRLLILNLTLVLLSTGFTALGQSMRRTIWCNFGGSTSRAPQLAAIEPRSAIAEAAIRRVLNFAHIPEDTYKIRVDKGYGNISAGLMDGQWWIVYDPDYVDRLLTETKTEWAIVAAVAHEVAHHILGHTKERPETEEEQVETRVAQEAAADRWAGATLRDMQCESREIAMAVFRILPDGSPLYPPRTERLVQVRQGWESAENQSRTTPSKRLATNMIGGPLSPLFEKLRQLIELDWGQLKDSTYQLTDQVICNLQTDEKEFHCSLGYEITDEPPERAASKLYGTWVSNLRAALPEGWQLVQSSELFESESTFIKDAYSPTIKVTNSSSILFAPPGPTRHSLSISIKKP
jgi:hypothetical protein